ncbi:MAG: bifunctional response regulator/alkaline phosphatase family protein [Gemmatimonadota bacterium]|nr:MAG: bifunctional response regulator/alkaline phosphatase family protein [Gemmatimonadota bacterium]
MAEQKKILWVDDEIDMLRSHIRFLEERGYAVSGTSSGLDAVELVAKEPFDLVLLDEMMPGKDGLTVLAEIKDLSPSLPVIMITKSEEERLMDEAIGKRIDDYLTKPVNPSQILSACKKILEKRRIQRGQITQDYVIDSNQIRGLIAGPTSWPDWIEIQNKLVKWDIELDQSADTGLKQSHQDQRRECNTEFVKFVERNYHRWLEEEDRPPLSVDVIRRFILPEIRSGRNVIFIVMDSMRLDQWAAVESLLYDYFTVQRDYYYAVLPTATPFARNAIFAGLFPDEVARRYPELWRKGGDDEGSLNRYEHDLLNDQLNTLGLKLHPDPKYIKILDVTEARELTKQIVTYRDTPLTAIVFNFVDILSHGRSESEILQEIAPDESALRSLIRSWFIHSELFTILKTASQWDCTVVLTSDHGSVLSTKGTTVYGDRETSTNLRYKYGQNLRCDDKHALHIKKPEEYRLPSIGLHSNFIIAKEDYFFLYPTKYHKYKRQFQGSFQHGGISLEEMILPVAIMRSK